MKTGKKEEWREETIALHKGYSQVPMDMTRFRSFVVDGGLDGATNPDQPITNK